jgi:hypothetical protein
MKHVIPLIICAALWTSCAQLKLSDVAGRWDLQRASIMPGDDTPVSVVIAIDGNNASITTQDIRDTVSTVARYLYNDRSGLLVPLPGNPRTYIVTARRKRIMLTDIEGNYLLFTRADSAQTSTPLIS